MSSAMEGDIQPVYLGGPLHGQPVTRQCLETGGDWIAVEPQEIQSTVPASFTFTQIRYSPQRFVWTSRFWGEYMIKIWVDSRLCERGRNLLMNRFLLHESGWIDRMQDPFTVPPRSPAPSPQETPDAQEQRSETDRPQ